ncbi:MAG: DUF4258 domain-containing protein [Terriglobia bacterium]
MPEYAITEHCAFELRRRGLTEEIIQPVLSSPEQRIELHPGRVVLQSRVRMGEAGKTYLLRVIVDIDRRPAEVVTAYRTSKFVKYWRESL